MHSLNNKHTYANFKKYCDHGNAKNLATCPKLVEKSFAKEDARDISLILPSFLVDFTPHTWLIPLGIVVIENKKPSMYRSATMRIDDDSYPVNRLIDTSNEPEIVFGATQLAYFEYLWRIRALSQTRASSNTQMTFRVASTSASATLNWSAPTPVCIKAT
jgi:hypothetical protein